MNRLTLPPSTVLILTYVLLLSASLSAQYTFTEHSPLPEEGRDDAAFFSLLGKLYVTGGRGAGFQVQGDLWEYNPFTDGWTELSPFPGIARQYAFSASIDGKAYLAGGLLETGEASNELWSYDPAQDLWQLLSPMPAAPRYQGLGFIKDGNLVYGAGRNSFLLYSDLWSYDPIHNLWEAMSSLPGEGRYELFSFQLDKEVYIAGGIDNTGEHLSNVLHWDADNLSWEHSKDLPAGIAYADAACTSDFCVIWDGLFNHQFSKELILPELLRSQYNQGPSFASLTYSGPSLRNSSLCVLGNRIYRFGGKDSAQVKYSILTSVQLKIDVQIMLFPNPNQGILNIQSDMPFHEIHVYDTMGKLVLKQKSVNVSRSMAIDMKAYGLIAGLYLICVDNIGAGRFVFSP